MMFLLLLGVSISTSVEAKKVRILAAAPSVSPPAVLSMTRDSEGNCAYEVVQGFYDLFAHVHRNTIASVELLTASDEFIFESRTFDRGYTIRINWNPAAPFMVLQGEAWSLALVLQSANGKSRVIDAMEFEAGTCSPVP
jgi:hypothetical protein